MRKNMLIKIGAVDQTIMKAIRSKALGENRDT